MTRRPLSDECHNPDAEIMSLQRQLKPTPGSSAPQLALSAQLHQTAAGKRGNERALVGRAADTYKCGGRNVFVAAPRPASYQGPRFCGSGIGFPILRCFLYSPRSHRWC